MIISVFDRVENIVGKGEIACTSNFSFSHDVFKRLLSLTCQKASLCGTGYLIVKKKNSISLINHKFYIQSLCLEKNLTI